MKSLEKAKVREEKIYSKLQTAILKKMQEAKESNFSKPWINPFFENAHNPFSKSIYRGFNQFMLSFECEDKNYSVNRWMTFKQAKEIGGNVKKGCASFEIIFYSFLYKKDGKYISQEKVKMLKLKTGKSLTELNISSSAFIKFYNVFNVEQIENVFKINSLGDGHDRWFSGAITNDRVDGGNDPSKLIILPSIS